MIMDTIIGGVAFVIDVQSPKKGSIWYTASWECKLCGAKSEVSEASKQNTDAGAISAARSQADRHVEYKHKPTS